MNITADRSLRPYLFYESPAALNWLVKAFGFRERFRLVRDVSVEKLTRMLRGPRA